MATATKTTARPTAREERRAKTYLDRDLYEMIAGLVGYAGSVPDFISNTLRPIVVKAVRERKRQGLAVEK